MHPVEYNREIVLEEKKEWFCPFLAKKRVKAMVKRMSFWMVVAEKEQIGIEEDARNFQDFYQRFQKKMLKGSKDHVGMLLLEGCASLALDRVVKLVRLNIRRIPQENVLRDLGQSLQLLTRKCISWIQQAKLEQVDVKEEENMLFQSNLSSLQVIKECHSNLDNIREVSQRRLFFLRQLIAGRVIRKVYSQRLRVLGGQCAEKLKGTDHVLLVSGILKEALEGLSSGGQIETTEQRCQEIFNIFCLNIQLLQENPQEYHRLADLEVARRQLETEFKTLRERYQKSPQKLQRIQEFQNVMLQFLTSEGDFKKILLTINRTMQLFAHQLSEQPLINSCGFLNEK